MYFVGNKSFNDLSEAMRCCSSGSVNDVVTDESGTVLMRHEEVHIEDIFGMMIAKHLLNRLPKDDNHLPALC